MKFKVIPAKDTREPVAFVSNGNLFLQFRDYRSGDQRNAILGDTPAANHVSVNGTGTIPSIIGYHTKATPIYAGDTVEITFE